MYKKYICIGITIDNIILEESKTPKILNIVLTPMDTGSPNRLTLEEMSNTARRILTENPEITQQMFEHLQTQLGPEQQPGSLKPVEEGPNIAHRESPSVRLSQLRFGQSPRGRFLLSPGQGMGFTLEIGQETSTFQLNVEGMHSEQPSTVEQPATVETEPVV